MSALLRISALFCISALLFDPRLCKMNISNSIGTGITMTVDVFWKIDDFSDDFTPTVSCHCSFVDKPSEIWSQCGPALVR